MVFSGCLIFDIFLRFFEFLDFLLDFLDLKKLFSKFLRLILKIKEVTTEQQKWPKISTNSLKIFFFCPKGKQNPWTKDKALHRC